jgi:hypothetical protein
MVNAFHSILGIWALSEFEHSFSSMFVSFKEERNDEKFFIVFDQKG